MSGQRPDNKDMLLSLPTPQPDMDAYRACREAALAASPRAKSNYETFQKSTRRERVADFVPTRIDIENVSRCNLRCGMCQVRDWTGGKRGADMSFDDFKKLIDSQYGLIEIKLQGMGEPLLGGDTFFEMIRYARARNIWVRTATNATVLHKNENYKKLVDSGVNEVTVSVDGVTADTYEKIRCGASISRLADNCRMLNEYAMGAGKLKPLMWVVLQRDNIGEFEQFVEFGHGLGFKRIAFSLGLNDWGLNEWKTENRKRNVEGMITYKMASATLEKGRALGIEVGFWSNAVKYETASQEKLCPWPFERAYVSSDMRIVPCCMIGSPETFDLGDARDFTAQWNSSTYQAFRASHLEGRIPRACRNCYSGGGASDACFS